MEIKITYDKSQIREYGTAMKKQMEEAVNRYIENMADFILSEAQRNLREDSVSKAFDRGTLYASGVSRREDDKAIVGFGGDEAKDYALSVEFGTNPGHRPPIGPLIAWARRVGIKKPERVAWAIAKKIEKTGLAERPFLRSAVETAGRQAERIWKESIESI